MSTDHGHRPSSRESILAATAEHLRGGGTISLDSAARAAGVTKPGLMYYFGTKEELMSALLDHLMSRYEVDLRHRLAGTDEDVDVASVDVRTRLRAYVDWVCETSYDVTDLVIFTDPRLRESLTRRWSERLEPWLAIPDGTPDEEHARLLAARLMADGLWFDEASGALPLPHAQKRAVGDVALDLIGTAR